MEYSLRGFGFFEVGLAGSFRLGSVSELRGFSAPEGFLLVGVFFLKAFGELSVARWVQAFGSCFLSFCPSLGPAQARVCSRLGGSLLV